MKTIWKFQFENKGMFGLDMPKGAEILTVQTQEGIPCIWALVDPNSFYRSLYFRIRIRRLWWQGCPISPIFSSWMMNPVCVIA